MDFRTNSYFYDVRKLMFVTDFAHVNTVEEEERKTLTK